METLVIDVNSKEDKKVFTTLAKRLHLKMRVITQSEKEDLGLALAIEEGLKSGYVDEKTVMNTPVGLRL